MGAEHTLIDTLYVHLEYKTFILMVDVANHLRGYTPTMCARTNDGNGSNFVIDTSLTNMWIVDCRDHEQHLLPPPGHLLIDSIHSGGDACFVVGEEVKLCVAYSVITFFGNKKFLTTLCKRC